MSKGFISDLLEIVIIGVTNACKGRKEKHLMNPTN